MAAGRRDAAVVRAVGHPAATAIMLTARPTAAMAVSTCWRWSRCGPGWRCRRCSTCRSSFLIVTIVSVVGSWCGLPPSVSGGGTAEPGPGDPLNLRHVAESHARRRATLASPGGRARSLPHHHPQFYNGPDQLSAELRAEPDPGHRQTAIYAGPDPVARSPADLPGLAPSGWSHHRAADLFVQRSGRTSSPAWPSPAKGRPRACRLVGYAGPGPPGGRGFRRRCRPGDGFVGLRRRGRDPYLQLVLQRQLPVVVVDQPTDVPGASRVGIDDRRAMRELATTFCRWVIAKSGFYTMKLGDDGGPGSVRVADADRIAATQYRSAGRADRRGGTRWWLPGWVPTR